MHKIPRSDILYWTAFGALLIAAVVLAYLIVKPDLSKMLSFRKADLKAAPAGNAPAEDERARILNTPPQSAPTSTKQEYFALVQKFAVETDTVDLTGCSATPVVARLKQGAMITFTNKDSSPRQLQVNPKHLYTIPAQGSVEIKADFGFGQGWYGYGCDDSQRAVGVFWVTL